MIRTDRRLLIQTFKLGLVLTVIVLIMQAFGWFGPIERRCYDVRAQKFQYFTPPATDMLVHLDIDDPALEVMGRWESWPRERLALIVDEMRLAGVKVFALDVLFPEHQSVRVRQVADGSIVKTYDDRLFAKSLSKVNVALVPVYFEPIKPKSKVYDAILVLLSDDLELSEWMIVERLRDQGFVSDDLKASQLRRRFLAARREAMHDRIVTALSESEVEISIEDLRKELLPRTPLTVTGSPLLRLLDLQYDTAISLRTLKNLAVVAGENVKAVVVANRLTPIVPITNAAHATGHVNRMEDPDHIVRNIPLFVEHEGYLFPQLGLAAACAALDVDLDDLVVEADRLTISPPDMEPIVLPLYSRRVASIDRKADLFFDLPWFGSDDWQTMYSQEGNPTAGHVPILEVWKVRQFVDRITANNTNADRAILDIFDDEYDHQLRFDPALAKKYKSQIADGLDFDQRKELIVEMLEQLKPWVEQYKAWPADEMTDDDRRQRDQLFTARDTLLAVIKQNTQLTEDLLAQRKRLRVLFEDKTVLLGWAATGVEADFVRTPLHGKCPGPVVHSLVFNSVMTNHTWVRRSLVVNLLATVIVSLLAILFAAGLSPVLAVIAIVMLAGVWVLVNGLLVFDYSNQIVDISPPLISAFMIWVISTIWKFVAERAERTRITQRFRSYVDPMLVNYVIENPEQTHLDGKVDELTVVFTDLVNFTSISERLREKSVSLLNQYMQLMVPVIREHRGYVNKFLGDGIMFFFGAPRENPNHARDAVATALKMQQMMVSFNGQLMKQNLPALGMRIGISTGEMVVGDAGPDDACDYTVLGDNVNLASRLESANKATGTQILINDRAAELVDNEFLLQPVARLQVIGKTASVMTYQPVCFIGEADDVLRGQTQFFDGVVKRFSAGEFDKCLELLDEHAGKYPDVKLLAEFYREQCGEHLGVEVSDRFDGTIALSEK